MYKALYKGIEVDVIKDPIASFPFYKVRDGSREFTAPMGDILTPVKEKVKIIKLIPDGYIKDSGNYLDLVKFDSAMPKNLPKEIIDHWLSWAMGEEEVVCV